MYQAFSKKETLFKGGHYLRKYGSWKQCPEYIALNIVSMKGWHKKIYNTFFPIFSLHWMGPIIEPTASILSIRGREKRRNTKPIWFCFWHCQLGRVYFCPNFWQIWGTNRSKTFVQCGCIYTRFCWS